MFQQKSFSDFVENNSTKNYEECRNFINNTSILSHLNEPDKTLIIQSLKIRTFPKGECIQKSNDKFSTMFFVKDILLQYVN